jgi:hypothetical protein
MILAPSFFTTVRHLVINRIDEIDKLILKTECVMELSESAYMQKKFRYQYQSLSQNRIVNEAILIAIKDKI